MAATVFGLVHATAPYTQGADLWRWLGTSQCCPPLEQAPLDMPPRVVPHWPWKAHSSDPRPPPLPTAAPTSQAAAAHQQGPQGLKGLAI